MTYLCCEYNQQVGKCWQTCWLYFRDSSLFWKLWLNLFTLYYCKVNWWLNYENHDVFFAYDFEKKVSCIKCACCHLNFIKKKKNKLKYINKKYEKKCTTSFPICLNIKSFFLSDRLENIAKCCFFKYAYFNFCLGHLNQILPIQVSLFIISSV